MCKNRFLQDGSFDKLFSDVTNVYKNLRLDDNSDEFMFYFIDSILYTFQENKILLEMLENVIVKAKQQNLPKDVWGPLTEASRHIKSGMITLHELLFLARNDVENINLTDFFSSV